MADVDLTVQQVTRAGIDATDTGALSTSDTYKFPNNGRTWLHFKKTGVGACTVTIATPNQVDGLAVADRQVTVPASTGDVQCGPWPREVYNDGAGKVAFTLSDVAGLTVAVMTLGQ